MDETIVWKDRKRIFFGLPWTFTRYALTEEKLYIKTGVFSTREEEVRLYRIMDVTLKRSLWERSADSVPFTAARPISRRPNLTCCTLNGRSRLKICFPIWSRRSAIRSVSSAVNLWEATRIWTHSTIWADTRVD